MLSKFDPKKLILGDVAKVSLGILMGILNVMLNHRVNWSGV